MVGAMAFHLAYAIPVCAFLIGVYVYAAGALTGVATLRQAIYFGLALGIAVVAPQLAFFWKIFSFGAIGLWLLLAVCLTVFITLGWRCRKKLRPMVALFCLPVLWTGIEYFRSELYYLRFSWLTPGLAFAGTPGYLGIAHIGVYGIGFMLAVAATGVLCLKRPWQRAIVGLCALVLLGMLPLLWESILKKDPDSVGPHIAGIQMEHPYAQDVLEQLDALHERYPKTDVYVLSEYTFAHGVTAALSDWCVRRHAYLIFGGIDETPKGWYDTAFVVGPDGRVVFKQAKAVPIQFMDDGLRAGSQEVWHSPWGAIGICICYDLSYTRVVDKLAVYSLRRPLLCRPWIWKLGALPINMPWMRGRRRCGLPNMAFRYSGWPVRAFRNGWSAQAEFVPRHHFPAPMSRSPAF